ncbi:sterol desaturase family protein [Schleiferia thermophila]|jgi:sterol desaturase/sphingolipid hydroxylase (fatty acid hydroxylase superfamily)|uniref:Sterol desaturase/sphingolipid hydroxylase (Fatty acid hydroxylase superfamily) n=1 Tax=Schleiferia thermophila TaxID=884107 RepID=A0A369A717_9FLAO|nr:sterol desaturase family protein [Schleiferia thermophila]KFD38153.1 fatty acid hydroxylase [Schleiferia thermophila str. Yellowstone]RCX05079.1 sterol desaturase/sphingolipid hydroxylase (fatty acid hydroxylase superfamily) [Schleiferia thermophila]GCD79403.1 fatty acid hydroxylase [Schleiferia thermophila]
MPNLIHYAIPGFVVLVLAELIFSELKKKHLYETKDTISSLSMGIGNVIVNLLGKAIALGVYFFIWQFRWIDLGFDWWVWCLIVLADDFTYYWYHRLSHEVRYLWASHVVHHSSRRYNLSTALRQTWTGTVSGGFLFWAWLPLVGFHPIMVLTMQSINLLYQFWIHTEVIDKLPGWFEWIFNTPSHHRVHHSSQPDYLDRNHAGIFIIWDRIFGTFVAEKQKPVYGLTKNINTYNPLKIAFHEWADLWRDVRNAPDFKSALMYLFGPPGWSHDGSRLTSKQIRQLAANRSKPNTHGEKSSSGIFTFH